MNDHDADTEASSDPLADGNDTAQAKEKGDSFLTEHEARVFACLMEKELTVPDSYPLTLNSLVLACNQKSNREPVMQLSEGEVGNVSRALADRHLVKIEYRGRTQKLEHKADLELKLDIKQKALLTVMLLRSPQTLNDLKTRTSRMVTFEDHEDLLQTIASMNDRYRPLVVHLPKGSGQREDRYTHSLCGEVSESEVVAIRESKPSSSTTDLSQIEELELRIRKLEARVELLEDLLQ